MTEPQTDMASMPPQTQETPQAQETASETCQTCDLGLNCCYITTKPAIYKCILLGLGMLAMALTINAHNTATYPHNKDPQRSSSSYHASNREDLEYEKIQNEMAARWNSPDVATLERKEMIPNTETNCNAQNKIHLKLKKMKFKPCPSTWLVEPCLYVISFTWTSSLLTLIVMQFYDLRKLPRFRKIDFIGHLLAGSLLLLSALSIGGFIVWIFLGDYPCVSKGYEAQMKLNSGGFFEFNEATTDRYGNTPNPDLKVINLTSKTKRGRYFALYFVTGKLKQYDSCADHTSATFDHWTLMVGTLFTGATGVMYIVTAFILKKYDGLESRMTGQTQKSQPGDPQSHDTSVHDNIISSNPSMQAT